MKDKLTGSSVLADASGVAKTVYGLMADGFYSADFVDLATIIEHAIIGTIELVPGGKAVPDAMFAPIKELIRDGAVRLLDERAPMIWEPTSIYGSDRAPPPEGFFNSKRSKPVDAHCEAARVASAELFYGRPGMLLARQRDTYDALARPPEEHLVCDLRLNHRRLTDALHAFKKRAHPPGFVLVRVPPFAHIVLSRASTFSEVMDITLTFRRKCKPLRDAEQELHEVMSSRDIGALEKAKQRDRFLGGWNKMIAACGETSAAEMEFANSTAHFLRHAKQTAFAVIRRDGEEALQHGHDAIKKLLESCSAEEWDQAHPWTLRPMRTAAWQYLTAPDRAMHDAAHRILKIPRTIVEARMRLLVNVLRQYSARAA